MLADREQVQPDLPLQVGAAGGRPVLTSGLDSGWLCFEASLQKRRLTPIPDDWERCPVTRLEEYCRAARPAMRISVDPKRLGDPFM